MRSTTDSCTTSSIISRNVIIVYGTIYGLLLAFVSIYSFTTLNKDHKFSNKSNCRQLKRWILDLRKRRNCYIPIIAHLFDQLTDISVAIQFYQIATDETKSNNDWEACKGLNIWYLFVLTMLTLIIYRIITGYLVYIYTNKSFTRLLAQILDLELFRSLYINYLCNKVEPCDPQRWITAMEAALESTPQSLIQLIYLVKTDTFDMSNILIIISLLSSLWSIISKLIADDKAVICQQAKHLNFRVKYHTLIDIFVGLFTMVFGIVFLIICCPCVMVFSFININMSNYDGEFEQNELQILTTNKKTMTISQQDEQIITVFHQDDYEMIHGNKQYNFYTVNLDTDYNKWLILYNNYDALLNGKLMSFNCNLTFFLEIFFIDQFKSPRSFSWLYIFRVIWRIFDVTSRLCIMVLTWSVIGGLPLGIIIGIECIVILFLCIKTKHWELIIGVVTAAISLTTVTKRISAAICWYRTISNFMLMIAITIWLFVEFECPKCTDYVDRQALSKLTSTIFGLFVYCWFSVILSPMLLNILFSYKIFIDGSTTSRALEQMIDARNWNGILEMQLYGEQYGIYNRKKQRKLLTLAIEQHKDVVIAYLLKKGDDTILPENILSIYNKLNTKNAKILISKVEICNKTDKNNNNILDIYETYSHASHITVLLDIYHKYPELTDKKGRNAFDILVYHYLQNSSLLTTNDLLNIQNQQPQLLNVRLNELFLCAVAVNNKQYFSPIITKMGEKVRSFTDFKNQGIFHYAALDGFQNWNEFFPSNKNVHDEKSDFITQLFEYNTDFDTNGLLYYLGTRMCTESYENPAEIGLVHVHDRSGSNKKLINSVVGREESEYYDFGDNKNVPHITISVLPNMIKLTHYSLKHYVKFSKLHEPIRNWELQGSQDGDMWKTISKHEEDYSLDVNGGTYTWNVDTNSYFSCFRILLTKTKTQSSINLILRCSGIEFYGETIRFDPVSFYKKYPQCLEHNGKSPFFESCRFGDASNVNKLIMQYPQLLARKDEDNKNILDYYQENNDLLDDVMIQKTKLFLNRRDEFDVMDEKTEMKDVKGNINDEIVDKKQNAKYDVHMERNIIIDDGNTNYGNIEEEEQNVSTNAKTESEYQLIQLT